MYFVRGTFWFIKLGSPFCHLYFWSHLFHWLVSWIRCLWYTKEIFPTLKINLISPVDLPLPFWIEYSYVPFEYPWRNIGRRFLFWYIFNIERTNIKLEFQPQYIYGGVHVWRFEPCGDITLPQSWFIFIVDLFNLVVRDISTELVIMIVNSLED